MWYVACGIQHDSGLLGFLIQPTNINEYVFIGYQYQGPISLCTYFISLVIINIKSYLLTSKPVSQKLAGKLNISCADLVSLLLIAVIQWDCIDAPGTRGHFHHSFASVLHGQNTETAYSSWSLLHCMKSSGAILYSVGEWNVKAWSCKTFEEFCQRSQSFVLTLNFCFAPATNNPKVFTQTLGQEFLRKSPFISVQ